MELTPIVFFSIVLYASTNHIMPALRVMASQHLREGCIRINLSFNFKKGGYVVFMKQQLFISIYNYNKYLLDSQKLEIVFNRVFNSVWSCRFESVGVYLFYLNPIPVGRGPYGPPDFWLWTLGHLFYKWHPETSWLFLNIP